jgi:hypothetical protein
MLKEVLKYRELKSSAEITEAVSRIWNGLAFNEVQSLFHNWMSRLG